MTVISTHVLTVVHVQIFLMAMSVDVLMDILVLTVK